MASVKEIQLKYHSIACCCGLMTSKSPNTKQKTSFPDGDEINTLA